ncbi:MAG: sigma-54-dependent Fis family transcriptional regulator, partial [Gemmatimonadetes bacterium]|nr:sigma-54-dependent Fis family transcriptional regulator [Gemmatimonadota bacterium]
PRLPARVPDGTLPVRSLLIVPFRTETDVTGIIYLDRFENRDPFGSRELDLVVGLVRSERFFLSLLASRQRELVEENSRLRMQVSKGNFDEIVTQSERMYEVLDLVRKVASTNVTVLIQGETGTGKQLVTKAVHGESPRRERTLYSINCATLPEQLLESELFGHIAGSFTGANRDKTGLLMEASGSSVFLDEIDKMKIGVQSKLLTVLEEKRIRPIGSNEYFDVDVRFICASNRDLKKEVEEGRFLEDLYYRLNTIKIDLPPLRDRVEDILLLAQYFLRVFAAEMGKETPRIDERASQALLQFSWPGNVRELRSEMRRVIVLHDGGPITVSSFSPAITNFTAGQEKSRESAPVPGEGPLKEQVDRFERQLLEKYLEEHGGNVSSMARDLGISRWGLHKKLERHGLR